MSSPKNWYDENLYTSWRQSFEVGKELFREKTEFQDMIIFENPIYGRVLALDSVIQTTEKDEFVYHEMLTHVPIYAHGAAKKVLIIGGGDGGILREVLKHKMVERAVMVEIDPTVVELSKQHLPTLSAGAFDNPKGEVIIDDGVKYMAQDGEKFDVIIVDSTDPVGPGEVLFRQEFYADCKKRLTERGILVTQNGVPFMQSDELTTTWTRMRPLFPDVSFFVAAVPSYVGGFMTLGWGSLDPANRANDVETIRKRFAADPIDTNYYTPEIHVACFALPNYVRKLMK